MLVKEAWLDREKLVTGSWKRSPAWHRSLSPVKCYVQSPQTTPIHRFTHAENTQETMNQGQWQKSWVIPLVDGRPCENNPFKKTKGPWPKTALNPLLCVSQDSDPKQLVEPSKPAAFGKRYYFKPLGKKVFISLILISVGNWERNCFCLFLPIPTDMLKPLQASLYCIPISLLMGIFTLWNISYKRRLNMRGRGIAAPQNLIPGKKSIGCI